MTKTNPKDYILIVEDVMAVRRILNIMLTRAGYKVQEAENGLDALNHIKKSKPGLIMLDVMMPKLSGFEVCKTIRENPRTRGIMILMVTALNELGDIERAVDAGADDFLSKPVNKFELIKRVQNMLSLKDIRDENERLRRYIQRMEDDSDPGNS